MRGHPKEHDPPDAVEAAPPRAAAHLPELEGVQEAAEVNSSAYKESARGRQKSSET